MVIFHSYVRLPEGNQFPLFQPCWLPVFCTLIFWFSSVAKSHVFKWKSKLFVGSMQSFKLNLDFVHVNSKFILIEIHINSCYCWFKTHCFSVRLLVVCWWYAPPATEIPIETAGPRLWCCGSLVNVIPQVR